MLLAWLHECRAHEGEDHKGVAVCAADLPFERRAECRAFFKNNVDLACLFPVSGQLDPAKARSQSSCQVLASWFVVVRFPQQGHQVCRPGGCHFCGGEIAHIV